MSWTIEYKPHMVVNVNKIKLLVNNLNKGKSVKLDGISTDHLIYAGKKIIVYLSFFTAMLRFSVVPKTLWKFI